MLIIPKKIKLWSAIGNSMLECLRSNKKQEFATKFG